MISKIPCRNWKQNGSCKYGDACHYKDSHSYTDLVPSFNNLSLIGNQSKNLVEKFGVSKEVSFTATIIQKQTIESKPKQFVHYIIAIDASGSMVGNRWKQVRVALKDLLLKIASANKDNRVSIICFSDEADIFQKYRKPDELLDVVDTIPFYGQGTNFGKPLIKTLELIESYAMPSTLIFMSDGEADYPKEAVDQLKSALIERKRYMYLFIIGIECGKVEVLERIRNKFGGRYDFNVKSADLTKYLVKIVVEKFEFKITKN